jgi:hypothetical protein
VYRRADLSRTFQSLAALSLTSAATGVFAREFRAADTQNEVVLAMPQQAWFSVSPDEQNIFHEAGFFQEAALAGIYARLHRDPAMAQLIERIRKVE